jgi:hypothetical protein
VGAINPKAMPFILTEQDNWKAWLTAPFERRGYRSDPS